MSPADTATRPKTSHEASVQLFSEYVRAPIRQGGDHEVGTLLEAYSELLPAVTTLIGYHFTRTLLKAALEHVERTGSPAERRAVIDRIGSELAVPDAEPAGGMS